MSWNTTNSTTLSCNYDDDAQEYYIGAGVTAACAAWLLPFIAAFWLGRPFRLLVSKRRTVAVNWLLVVLAASLVVRTLFLGVGGFYLEKKKIDVKSDVDRWIPMQLLNIVIHLLQFVGVSSMLPHMGYASHAHAYLASGSKQINYTKVDELTVLGWDITHLVLDRWLLFIQVVMVVAACQPKFRDANGPIFMALQLQYGIVNGLVGLLYLGVSIAQRDFLRRVLSRTFCPRRIELEEKDDVVGVDSMRNDDTFVQLGADLLAGRTFADKLDINASAEAVLAYHRERARERAAGSYAFFGFMTAIAGLFFLYRGILGCISEVKPGCGLILKSPILRFVIPEVVPMWCIVEVLLPYGILSYVVAWFRPVKILCGYARRTPAHAEPASAVHSTATIVTPLLSHGAQVQVPGDRNRDRSARAEFASAGATTYTVAEMQAALLQDEFLVPEPYIDSA